MGSWLSLELSVRRGEWEEGVRESFIRNNLHNGVVSGAARGQALRGCGRGIAGSGVKGSRVCGQRE